MNTRVGLKTLFSMGFAAVMATGAASAAGETCTTDTDCADGDFCAAAPCLPPDCDPADPTCKPPECPSMCTPRGSGGDPIDPNGCATDADCGAGFECAAQTPMTTDCACPEGADACDCTTGAEPVEYKACQPKQCASNADCPTGLECASVKEPCAATPPCPAGEACEPVLPCEPTTQSWCQPMWAGTCEADADCGSGFTCKAYEQCVCSGSGGSTGTGSAEPGSSGGSAGSEGGGSGGAAPPPDGKPPTEEVPGGDVPVDDDGCTCAPSSDKYCEPVQKECAADAECPADWKCESFGMGSGGTSTSPATDGGAPCPPGESCEAAPPAPDASPVAPVEKKMCVPPYYTDWSNAGALPEAGPMGDDGSFANQTKGDDTAGPTDDSGGTGAPTGTGGSASSGSGSSTSAGCTVDGTGRIGAGLPALLLLGLAGLFSRRRIASK